MAGERQTEASGADGPGLDGRGDGEAPAIAESDEAGDDPPVAAAFELAETRAVGWGRRAAGSGVGSLQSGSDESVRLVCKRDAAGPSAWVAQGGKGVRWSCEGERRDRASARVLSMPAMWASRRRKCEVRHWLAMWRGWVLGNDAVAAAVPTAAEIAEVLSETTSTDMPAADDAM